MATVTPGYEDFATRHATGEATAVSCLLGADLETPVSVLLKLGDDAPYNFLLESVEGGATLGRYSLIGCKPDLVWTCRRNQAFLAETPGPFAPQAEPPLDSLRTLIARSRIDLAALGLPPMAAGLFGYFGYDMIRQVERIPDNRPDPLALPDSVFMRPSVMVVFDNLEHTMRLVTPVWPSGQATAEAWREAEARLLEVRQALRRPVSEADSPPAKPAPAVASNTPREAFLSMVERAKTISRRAISSRWCSPSASACLSPDRRWRSTGRCGG